MGIFRKKVFELVKKLNLIELIEAPISPFDLQKAEELFLTNVIFGIQPITKYRKKEFETKFSSSLLEKFNEHYI
jgi:branched-chain amino acid aminotransferase